MKEMLHVGYPNIGNRQKFHERVTKILDSHWLTNRGEFVQEFEKNLAEYLGVKHCITMCNGTIALEIAIRALDLKGEVIIPSFTFIATAHALQWQQITPVFCDINPDTFCIEPDEIRKHITPRTSGILGVHIYGNTCDTEKVESIARDNNLKVMYDASHSFGCAKNGTMIGNFGDCEVFSFHATKVFNTFEGGAIATNNDELAEKIRLMQNFGFSGMDNVIYIGTNGKMSEINAAMGLTNLESLDDFIEINRQNYLAYKKGFDSISGLKIMEHSEKIPNNFQYIVVTVDEDFPISREELLEKLHGQNIRVRRYFWPGCHRMEPYKSLYPYAKMQLARTEWIAEKIIVFPTGSAVTPSIVKEIINIIVQITLAV